MVTLEQDRWTHHDAYSTRLLSHEGARFVITEVVGPGHFVLKKPAPEIYETPPREGYMSPDEAERNLGNSVAWAQAMAAKQPGSFDVPRATAKLEETPLLDHKGHAVRTEYIGTNLARFEWVPGRTPLEKDLPDLCAPIARIVKELSGMRVDWREDGQNWIKQKFNGPAGEALNSLEIPSLQQDLRALTTADILETLRSGVTHGDIVPKNIVLQPNGRIALLDAEFGTHEKRPAFTVPRMRDAAYFYHILRCQYEQPETAESFLEAMGEEFGEDPSWHHEFWTCVIERTLTMYHHFVMRQPDTPGIDPRRKQPDNYIVTLHNAVEMLQAA